MRKIIPLLFSIVLLCASCVREAEFDDNFNTAYNNMGDALVLGITMAEEISQVWYKAIFENKMPNGRYCSDYNDAPITGFFTEGQQKHLFIVDEWTGLDEGTARSVIEYLNGLNKG